MTNDKKNDEKGRKKASDEELKDVAGGGMGLCRMGTQKSTPSMAIDCERVNRP